ncbi:MAG: PD40 domain-containing protein [Candidatus Latescibacterota bacterium]|nr:MAG: PD40 domain-containing protein [Candidatus Latescibacterota bacterium]
MIGRTISHYKILEKLGGGGMGVVYKAEDTRLRRLVALKFLAPGVGADETAKSRFIHEARTASALQHNNICTIHSIDETPDGQFFISMEYYEGATLGEKLADGPLAIDTVVDVMYQICEGLEKAHAAGMVHRDIKPANIMVTTEGDVKILDFGVAKLAGAARLTKTGSTVGTVAYMSPEHARGEDTDHRSDIFSLGVVAYELLTGQIPFKGDHETAILYSIMNNDADPVGTHRRDVPPELETAVGRMLQKDPVERYQDITQLKRDLDKLRRESRSEMGVQPEGDGVAARDSRASLGRRFNPSVLGVMVVVVAAVLVLTFWTTRLGDDGQTGLEKPAGIDGQPIRQVSMRQITFSAGVEEYPALSADGKRLAYCAEVNGYRQIFVKDLVSGDTRQLTRTSRDNIHPAWAPDGQSLVFVRSNTDGGTLQPGVVFGVHRDGDVWLRSLDSGEETKIIDNAFNPSFSPDGLSLAFDASLAGPRRIWVADNMGRNPQQLSHDPSEAVKHISPRWSPDGSKIAFQNRDGTIHDIKIIDVATRRLTSVTNDRFQDLNPVWSPTGSAVLFSSYRSGGLNVWRIPVASDGSPVGPPEHVTTGAGEDVQLTVSFDAGLLALSILGINADLWRLPVDPNTGMAAGDPEPLVATTREDSRGAWSPDGQRIAFNSDRSGDMNIFVLSLEDGAVKQVTRGPGGDYQPTWSPDGRALTFFSSRTGNADIWTIDLTTGDLVQLTDRPSVEINPFYSPDGAHIAFQSTDGGHRELWLMNADGSEQRRLTQTGVRGHYVMWSAKSEAVIVLTPARDHNRFMNVPIGDGAPVPFTHISGGAHMSFSPAYDAVMDVVGHRVIWVTPLDGEEPRKVFEFDDPDARLDYPVWSPDGRWVLFDRVKPEGGDIWLVDGLE